MTKLQVIKLLHKRIGLFKETWDESSLGSLYLSKLEFKKVEEILEELKSQEKQAKEWTSKLKDIVENNGRFNVWLKNDERFSDRVFNLPEPLILINSSSTFMNNIFKIEKDKNG